MSQQQPEPSEPAGIPPEPTNIPTEPVAIPPAPPVVPVPPALAPSAPTRIAGPDLQQVTAWMRQSQLITAKVLYDLGVWVFGGLIIAALMLLQDLIPLGSADRATVVAGLAIAIALPFNLAGLGIIRYFNDVKQTVEEARKTLAQSSTLDAEALIKLTRASDSLTSGKQKAMDFSVSLALYLSVLFTVIGYGSALWRISWAATLLLLIVGVLAVLLVARTVRSS